MAGQTLCTFLSPRTGIDRKECFFEVHRSRLLVDQEVTVSITERYAVPYKDFKNAFGTSDSAGVPKSSVNPPHKKSTRTYDTRKQIYQKGLNKLFKKY